MNKKNILLIAMLSLTGLLKAQQTDSLMIMNGGFEKWDTLPLYSDPANWSTFNYFSGFGYTPNTTITTDAHSGKYAAQLTTESNPNGDIPGVLSSGPILDDNFNTDFSLAKFRFTGRPYSLRFYYKAFPVSGDSCAAFMLLTRKDTATGKIDTIGSAGLFMDFTVSTYTLANLPFTYNSTLAPDSAFIIISSSFNGFNPPQGSTMYIDDMELAYVNGINEMHESIDSDIYPNPASGIISIRLRNANSATLEIADEAGRVVLNSRLESRENNLDISSINPGIYFITLRGEQLLPLSSKIVITR